MLVSFSIENYRSFYEKMTLDMRIDIENKVVVEENPYVFKINNDYISKLCILYGHNGAGKSNLLNALQYIFSINTYIYDDKFMPKIFYDSIIKSLFTPNMIYGKHENTKFTVEFYSDYPNNNYSLYKYELVLNNENLRIESEFFQKNNEIIFERNNNSIINGIEFFNGKKGIPDQNTVIYYFNNVDEYKKYIENYRMIFKFTSALFLMNNNIMCNMILQDIKYTYDNLNKFKFWELYKKLISLADVGIDDIKVVKYNKGEHNPFVEDKFKLISKHQNYEDDFLAIESDGTKIYASNLISILLPIYSGDLCILDEFNGVQSELIELIISLFQKNMFDDLEKQTAQLILSTHDTNLMGMKNLLLNHFWFIDKKDNKSELYCASDFEGLEISDLENKYKRNELSAKYNSKLFDIPSNFKSK
ncbi:ATP-binding protein [uncultured Brachyspira sp.]|uniref:AAA family ATPase n=1 Tax=uncultured Brachyspira sp. TaxID=221953 RepID=UPI002586CB10|nr:ATP-binding protein [uncultured Brachyspira sp.]